MIVCLNNVDTDQTVSVHSVCFHDKIKSEVHLNIYSRHKSRQHFQDKKGLLFGSICYRLP